MTGPKKADDTLSTHMSDMELSLEAEGSRHKAYVDNSVTELLGTMAESWESSL
jgi:hypothetical protein